MKQFKILNEIINKKFRSQFGFDLIDITFAKIVDYMYAPKDSSSLAFTRILFGLAMLFDIPDERGGSIMDKRWGDPKTCHFPLLPYLQPILMPYMALVYAIMWLGALGIMLGYKYRVSALAFTICYWYLFLVEKSYWNNHSYLFGLVALLLTCTKADSYWSLDAYLDPSKISQTVPYWNYFILKYQFFILYFMAGVKKGTAEWLTGYSVENLSQHWVFEPFKLFLTVPQTDYLVVHWFVFLFDLTVAMWMMWSPSRHLAMIFCAMFHLMNSRLFRIGMFPWVCLATMPLFYPFNWPKTIIGFMEPYKVSACKIYKQIIQLGTCKGEYTETIKENCNISDTDLLLDDYSDEETDEYKKNNQAVNKSHDLATSLKEDGGKDFDKKVEKCKPGDENCQELANKNVQNYKKKKITVYLILFYVISQAFLPYSHFITKGYNNWTNGLYGYSWDMMVHTWDIRSIVVKVVDNETNITMYIDPYLYTLNERWTRHGDMVFQYAKCLKRNIDAQTTKRKWNDPRPVMSNNISIYFDIWCSMNGRFVQRMFDPHVDMLKASWSPFKEVPYLLPLLDEALHWRTKLVDIKNEVYSWSQYSDVVFFADFPGYEHEKYIPVELQNVSVTVLGGTVAYEPMATSLQIERSYKLTTGNRIRIYQGTFHKIINIGETPAYYMYTFLNSTEIWNTKNNKPKPKLPIFRELYKRFSNMATFTSLVVESLFQIFCC